MTTFRRNFKHIGGYEPLLELGQGGMGVAYLARALGAGGFERLIVVKRLHQHLLHEGEAKRRFLDEARVSGFVRHANVVSVHQAGSDEEGHYIVLEYVEGGGLDEIVDRAALRGVPVPVPVVLRMVVDALAGLHAIHEATDGVGRALSILHRDVSPQNVLVGRDGLARIADFGVAKSAIASVATDKTYVVGKLLYMPPEYLRREPITRTLDVYAVGVTMWFVLAGQDPFPDANEGQLVNLIMTEGIPSVSSVAKVPPQVEAIVAKACKKDPDARFQSAREMAEAIEEIGKQTGWVATHAEVAAFIESLLGVDSARRREQISTEIQKRPSLSESPTLAAIVGGSPSAGPTARTVAGPSASQGPPPTGMTFSKANEVPPNPRWVPWAIVSGGVLATALGLFVWFGRVPEQTENGASAVQAKEARPSAPSAPVLAAEKAPAARESAVAPEDLPRASEVTPVPVSKKTVARRAPPSPSVAPPASVLVPKPLPPEAPVREPLRGPASQGNSPLDSITKRNPYR